MIRGVAAYSKGKSHLKNGKENQDAYCVLPLQNMWIAAVADGVGSCQYAEKASKIAVETVANFVCDNMPIDNAPISVKSMLRTGFNRALKEIQKEAEKNNRKICEYETTLMVVIFDGRRGYFASVGDGGIIGLKMDGTYIELTTRQQTEDGFVIPLSAGYGYWQISEIEEDLAAICLVTDGIRDKIVNAFLEQGLYVPLLMLFSNPYVIQFLRRKDFNYSQFVDNPSSVPRSMIYNALYYGLRREGLKKATALNIVSTIKRGMLFDLLDNITDDKTIVCLYHDQLRADSQGAKYYMEPNWKRIFEKRQKLLYPTGYEYENDDLSTVATGNIIKHNGNKRERKVKFDLFKTLRKKKNRND